MVPKGVFDTRVEGFIPSHYHLDMKHGWLGKQVHGQLSYVQKGSKGIKRDQKIVTTSYSTIVSVYSYYSI